MPKIVKAGSPPDHKSLIPPQALTTSSLFGAHDHATVDVADDSDDGGFTSTSELSVGEPPLQVPRVDQAMVVGNSLIVQMDGEHVPDQRCGHTTPIISTINTTTTTISNNFTGPTTSSVNRTSTSRTSEIITGTNSSLPTISTNPTEASGTSEIITRTNNSSLPTISTNSMETGSLNTETPTEGQEEKESFQLGRTLLGLTFEAAVALMVFRFRGNSSSPLSPSSSASLPPRPPSSSLASVLSSFPFAMVWATIVCGFTVTLIGVILRKAHSTAANLCNYAGIFSVGLGFFLMMEEMCIPERFVWLVWAAAGILVIVFAYALARRSGKKE